MRISDWSSDVCSSDLAAGIGSQVHYIPVHLQPYYRRRYGALTLPGAERYYARTLSLPLFAAMAESDVDRAVEALTKVLRNSGAATASGPRRSAQGGDRTSVEEGKRGSVRVDHG